MFAVRNEDGHVGELVQVIKHPNFLFPLLPSLPSLGLFLIFQRSISLFAVIFYLSLQCIYTLDFLYERNRVVFKLVLLAVCTSLSLCHCPHRGKWHTQGYATMGGQQAKSLEWCMVGSKCNGADCDWLCDSNYHPYSSVLSEGPYSVADVPNTSGDGQRNQDVQCSFFISSILSCKIINHSTQGVVCKDTHHRVVMTNICKIV